MPLRNDLADESNDAMVHHHRACPLRDPTRNYHDYSLISQANLDVCLLRFASEMVESIMNLAPNYTSLPASTASQPILVALRKSG